MTVVFVSFASTKRTRDSNEEEYRGFVMTVVFVSFASTKRTRATRMKKNIVDLLRLCTMKLYS